MSRPVALLAYSGVTLVIVLAVYQGLPAPEVPLVSALASLGVLGFGTALASLARGRAEGALEHSRQQLEVRVQERTAQLLEAGTVMGAVTSQREPVAGCVASPLGRMRYVPIASRALAERWFSRGLSRAALEAAPIVDFDRHDTLQAKFAHRHGARTEAPRHVISASAEFAEAVRMGLGWGMLLPGQFEAGLADGSLVQLAETGVEVPLWWQRWNLSSPLLDLVTDAVQSAARTSPALV